MTMTDRSREPSLGTQRLLILGSAAVLLIMGSGLALAGAAWPAADGQPALISSDRSLETTNAPVAPAADSTETPTPEDGRGLSVSEPPAAPALPDSTRTPSSPPPRAEDDHDDDDERETVAPKVRDEDDHDGDRDDESDKVDDDEDKDEPEKDNVTDDSDDPEDGKEGEEESDILHR